MPVTYDAEDHGGKAWAEVKDPADVKDYSVDFSAQLGVGETVDSRTVVAATGLTVDSSSIVTSNTVRVWLSGGTAGLNYRVTVTAVTSGGRTLEVDGIVRVRER